MKKLTTILILAFLGTTLFAQRGTGKTLAATWLATSNKNTINKIVLKKSNFVDSILYSIFRNGKVLHKGKALLINGNASRIYFQKGNIYYTFGVTFNSKNPKSLNVQRTTRNASTGQQTTSKDRYERKGGTKAPGSLTSSTLPKLKVSLSKCKNCKQYRIQLVGKNFKKSLVPNNKGQVIFKNVPIQHYKAIVIWNGKGKSGKPRFKSRSIDLPALEAEDRLGNFEVMDLMNRS